jgi:SAM-dependent methyltransferase
MAAHLQLSGLRVDSIAAEPVHAKVAGPFLPYDTPAASDFYHPDFERHADALGREPIFHRKIWEWVYILHHLEAAGALRPGSRGLGFGVGTEPLPSVFAGRGVDVVATDAPPEIGVAAGWLHGDQLARKHDDVHDPRVIDRATFEARVTFATLDMNAVTPALGAFDFCWSACSLEHLGSLRHGLDFVIASVEQTLKPGGIAVHTTELNLSSDTETLEDGPTVIYRRRDLLALQQELRDRGHEVKTLAIAPNVHPLDHYIDTPPYAGLPHLKLQLAQFASTSVGLVVRRGGGASA